MKLGYLVVSIALVGSPPDASAEWASDWMPGCKVELPATPAYADINLSLPFSPTGQNGPGNGPHHGACRAPCA